MKLANTHCLHLKKQLVQKYALAQYNIYPLKAKKQTKWQNSSKWWILTWEGVNITVSTSVNTSTYDSVVTHSTNTCSYNKIKLVLSTLEAITLNTADRGAKVPWTVKYLQYKKRRTWAVKCSSLNMVLRAIAWKHLHRQGDLLLRSNHIH